MQWELVVMLLNMLLNATVLWRQWVTQRVWLWRSLLALTGTILLPLLFSPGSQQPTELAIVTHREGKSPLGTVWGHRGSHIYHAIGCPNYPRPPVNLQRWQSFASPQEAEQAGYRAARNCQGARHADPHYESRPHTS